VSQERARAKARDYISHMIATISKISIRLAVPSDVPRIADMMRSVSDRDHSVETVRAITADFPPGEFYAWIAEAADEPVGLTMLEPCMLEHRGVQTRARYWRYLWVSPEQRRTDLYHRLVFIMMSPPHISVTKSHANTT
jgi:hypothetical protein